MVSPGAQATKPRSAGLFPDLGTAVGKGTFRGLERWYV